MRSSALIPAALMEAANERLEFNPDGSPTGHGPNNFSVPLGGGGDATHAGLSCGDVAGFLDLLLGMQATGEFPGLVIEHGDGPDQDSAAFDEMVAAQALQRYDGVPENLPMRGDERTFEGKTWISLIDLNVWQPPVAWREVVHEGFPDWIQPVGAVDAYRLGDRVTHEGQIWENTGSDANVWPPGVFGWTLVP